MGNTYTKYTHLTNEEIISYVHTRQVLTDLEIELVERLAVLLDHVKDDPPSPA